MTADIEKSLAVWRDPWMWLGRRTYGADLLGLAGGAPVLDDPATRYPRLDPETLAARDPDWCCCPPSRTRSATPTPTRCPPPWGVPGPSWSTGRALTWYGPRIPAALAAFRDLFGGTG
jgi:ABC-type Fe3+-hydroxamate transport system substrate-binding protein